uniref:Rab-GAP TBC domain-containing protein n=1 Tax=Steinernema glaseri TaxID=37863 RepID=A0A1I8AUQ4_9BILA
MSLSEPVTPSDYEEVETIKLLDSVTFSDHSKSSDFADDSSTSPISLSVKRKTDRLNEVLNEASVYGARKCIDELRRLASSCPGCLVSSEYRLKVWPLLAENLIGSHEPDNDSSSSCSDSDFESAVSTFSEDDGDEQSSSSTELGEPSIDDLKLHEEWNQVDLDVNRLLSRFPPYIPEERRRSLQKELTPIIVRVLWQDRSFRYYQGFHDVCLTLVLVLGSKIGYKVAKALSTNSVFHRFLTRSLEESAMRDLNYMYVLLWKEDPSLERFMRNASVGCMFALSWILTWFSHSLQEYTQVVQFFDFFLSNDPMMPVYVSAALVLSRRDEIFTCEPEMPVIHHLLSRIPKEFNVDDVLSTASKLILNYPPTLVRGAFWDRYIEQVNAPRKQAVPRINRYAVNTWLFAGAATAAFAYWVFTHYAQAEMAWMG